jgi:hypothetical protein
LIANVTRVELVGGDVDADVILRFVRLGSRQERSRALTVTASWIVAIRRAAVVGQPVKAIEVVSGK